MDTVYDMMKRKGLAEDLMKSPVSTSSFGVGDAIIVRDREFGERVYAGRVQESNPRLKYVVVMLAGGGVRAFGEGSCDLFRIERPEDADLLADGRGE
jgi:hypothetical protein